MKTPSSHDSTPRSCGQSTASLVCGILSFLCFGPLAGIPAIVLGHVAQSKIGKSHGTLTGAGKSLAGLILGYVNLALSVVVIPIYAAILVPAVENALFQGRLTVTMNNGRNMYVSIFQESLAEPSGDAWPKSGPTNPDEGTFENSTDYFSWMVTSDMVNVDYSFFGAPGLAAAEGEDPYQFAEEHNAWCIVAGAGDPDYPDTAPVLFTRNVPGESLADLKGYVRLTGDAEPFGTRGAVVILKDGSAFIVRDDRRTWEGIMANAPADLSNRILRP